MDEPLGKDFSYLCPLSVLFSCSRSLPSAREGRGRGRALPLSVVLQSLRTHQNSNFWPHFPPPQLPLPAGIYSRNLIRVSQSPEFHRGSRKAAVPHSCSLPVTPTSNPIQLFHFETSNCFQRVIPGWNCSLKTADGG